MCHFFDEGALLQIDVTSVLRVDESISRKEISADDASALYQSRSACISL